MLVAEVGDNAAVVVEDAERGDAERRDGFGIQHQHGFERVVEVGVEVEFEARNLDRLRPLKRERGCGVAEGGEPDVGLIGGTAKTVAEVFWSEERDWRLDAEGEVFSAGATLGYPEFKALDAGAGRWFLARGLGDGAVKFLRDGEDAGEALVAEVRGERGVGGEAGAGPGAWPGSRRACDWCVWN
jgi:hypothetical protein